jgi:hypothetical protein
MLLALSVLFAFVPFALVVGDYINSGLWLDDLL